MKILVSKDSTKLRRLLIDFFDAVIAKEVLSFVQNAYAILRK